MNPQLPGLYTGNNLLKAFRRNRVKFYLATGCLFFLITVSGQVIRSASGNAATVTASRDLFRADIGGGVVAGPNGSFGGLRREINWDGVPDALSAPNNFPANFFNVNSPRGAIFSTPGTGFQLSANAGVAPVEFANIDPTYSTLFAAFTAQRLFTALGSTITDVTFFVPGTNAPALTRGFGAIFSDVDIANVSSIQFFDQNNVSLLSVFVPSATGDETFSFLGVSYPTALIARVRITSGNLALGPGVIANDLVVMDDFLYGEPVANCSNPPGFLTGLNIVLDTRCGFNEGNISIIPTSGTPPFTYSIDGGTTYVAGPNGGFTFMNLAPGSYQLRLKDAGGCESAMVARMVRSIGAPIFLDSRQIVLDATCGLNDGNISIIPTSGTPPFMYSINGGVNYVAGPNAGLTFNNLAPGNYQLRLRNATCESGIVAKTVLAIYGPNCLTALGLPNAEKLAVVSISPNPSPGRFKVQLQNFNSSKAELTVSDGIGTIVQRRQVVLTHNNTIDFDLSGFDPGLYYFKVVTKNGMKTARIIIQ